jgi:hypothetical protein
MNAFWKYKLWEVPLLTSASDTTTWSCSTTVFTPIASCKIGMNSDVGFTVRQGPCSSTLHAPALHDTCSTWLKKYPLLCRLDTAAEQSLDEPQAVQFCVRFGRTCTKGDSVNSHADVLTCASSP